MEDVSSKKYVNLRKRGKAPSSGKLNPPQSEKKYKSLKPTSKELKPLKPAHPGSFDKKGKLKPLKPTSRELKPLKPSSRVMRPYNKAAIAEKGTPIYVPTHFRLRAPKRRLFRGSDSKFNSKHVQDCLKAELEKVLQGAHKMPKMGNQEELIVSGDITDDCKRYYYELNDPEILAYDLATISDVNPFVAELIYGRGEKTETFSGEPSRKIDIPMHTTMKPYLKWMDPGVMPVYLEIPPWYRGFVHDTNIQYWAENRKGDIVYGAIRFEGREDSLTCPLHFNPLKPGNVSAKNHIEFAEGKEMPGADQFTLHVFYKQYATFMGNLFVYNDLFNNITIFGPPGEGGLPLVRLTKVVIRLNNIVILNTEELDPDFEYQPNWIDDVNGFDLSTMILNYKTSRLIHDLEIDANPIYRIRGNEVLRTVAMELGHPWKPKYGAPWGENWCYDFSSWAMKEAGIKNVPRPKYPGAVNFQKGLTHLAQWFIRNYRYINGDENVNDIYRRGNVKYTQLNSYIKPGFFMNINNGLHGVFFVDWETKQSIAKTRKIRVINGNSNFKVRMGTTEIYYKEAHGGIYDVDNERFRHTGFYWFGNSYNRYQSVFINDPPDSDNLIEVMYKVFDGFGDTEKSVVTGLKPK